MHGVERGRCSGNRNEKVGLVAGIVHLVTVTIGYGNHEYGNVVGVVVAKLNQQAAFAASGSMPENVNYAVKSSYLLSFLESVPEVAAKLKEPNTKQKVFEEVAKELQQAAVLVLVY